MAIKLVVFLAFFITIQPLSCREQKYKTWRIEWLLGCYQALKQLERCNQGGAVFLERLTAQLEEAFMSNASDHWEKSKSLLFKTLAVWAFFAFIIHFFGSSLNSGSFPGGYFMAGMGAQIAFAILIFWFVRKQGQIDDEHGVSE